MTGYIHLSLSSWHVSRGCVITFPQKWNLKVCFNSAGVQMFRIRIKAEYHKITKKHWKPATTSKPWVWIYRSAGVWKPWVWIQIVRKSIDVSQWILTLSIVVNCTCSVKHRLSSRPAMSEGGPVGDGGGPTQPRWPTGGGVSQWPVRSCLLVTSLNDNYIKQNFCKHYYLCHVYRCLTNNLFVKRFTNSSIHSILSEKCHNECNNKLSIYVNCYRLWSAD